MLRETGERAQCGPALTSAFPWALKRVLRRELARARTLWSDAGLAVALACAYVLAARLGYALLGELRGVAVVWPAAGLGVGALIALGPRIRAAVAAGVLAGTLAAALMVSQPAWAALCLGLLNAAQALLAATLMDRWCGRPLRFDDWRSLWGFLAAASLAAATLTFGSAAVSELPPAAAPLLEVWRIWAVADGLGIIVVAPLLVGLYHLAADPVPRAEAAEGAAVLAMLTVASILLYTSPPGSALAEVPPAVLFPLLLWIAARCRPVFAAAAAVVISTALVGATTFHLGPFAAAPVPTVQAVVLIGCVLTLTLSTLFAERRRSEAALRESNERLRLALSGADLGVWSVDLRTGAFESDERDACINGHDPLAPPRTLAEARQCLHPDDLPVLDAAFRKARRTGAVCRTEYRVLPPPGSDPQQSRWAAMEGSVVCDANGRVVRLMGVTRDITERKLAEQVLAERTAQLALAGRAGLVGSYVHDFRSGMIQVSPGLCAIYGMPDDTVEITREEWRRRVLAEDMVEFKLRRDRAYAARQREMLCEYRIRRPDGEVRWIEQRSYIDYDDGQPRRSVGVNIDMTERKRDEEHKSLLVAELDHRVKNVLAVVSALLARNRGMKGSATELVAALDGRIKSMATAHELLSDRKWHGLPLGELIARELEPYAAGGNVETDGPDVVLCAEAGQALAMVVHELVTNAAKYGALSAQPGCVSVRWRLVPANGAGAHLAIDWHESGGPPLAGLSRIGYGTSVIRDLIPYELDGTAELAFPPEGVRCHLRVPARWLGSPTPIAQSEHPSHRRQDA